MLYVPYLIILSYPLLGFINKGKIKKIKPEYTFFLYLFFAALRGNGNGDYFNYINGIHLIDDFTKVIYGTGYPFEIGFRFIAYINNVLKLDPQFTIAVLNLISLNNIRIIINKYSKDQWLSWLMYFPFLLLFEMHHTRASVAMTFSFLVFHELIFEKRLIRVSLYSLLAFSFHKSSIFTLFLIYVYGVLTNCFKYDFLKSLFTKYSIFFAFLIRILVPPKKILINLHSYFPDFRLLNKAVRYLERDRWSYPFELYDPRLWILIFVFVVAMLITNRRDDKEKHYVVYTLLAILTIILLSESTIMTMRLYNYFNLATVMLIPYIYVNIDLLSKLKLNNLNLGITMFWLIFFGYLLYFILLIIKQVPYYIFI